MGHSYRVHRQAFIRSGLLLAFVGLVVHPDATIGAVPTEDRTTATDEGERVFSGPQPGEKVAPFKVLRIKENEPEELEIVKETDDRTTLICFVHRLGNDDRILFGLGLVDFYAARQKGLNSHFVVLHNDQEKVLKMLQGWARGSLFTKTVVSVSVDGVEGPGSYGLNRNVAMTVVVAKGDTVVSNLVFKAPNRNDLGTIMAEVAKTLGQPKPSVADVQKERRAEFLRRRDERIKASPVFKLAPNEQLGRIMFGLVNARGNRVQNAKRRSEQLLKWAGDNKERQAALKTYCKAVLAGEFSLNRYSRMALRKLAGTSGDED